MELFKKIFVKETITYYDSADVLPLDNWINYFKTQDLTYFNDKRKVSKDNENAMVNCFNDYIKISENHDILRRFGKIHKIMKFTGKYNSVMMLCNAILSYKDVKNMEVFNELVENLERWNYKIDRKKDVFEQVYKISKRVQGLKTQIELLEIELKKDDNEEATSIERQLLVVGKGLGLNYRLKSSELTLKEWLEMQNQLKEEIKQQQKSQTKK